jgi:hypothetical protein
MNPHSDEDFSAMADRVDLPAMQSEHWAVKFEQKNLSYECRWSRSAY